MANMLHLDPSQRVPILRHKHEGQTSDATGVPILQSHNHPRASTGPPTKADGSIYFIGTATTIIEWNGARILTDPNFLHAGDHVHLGPGVTAKRLTNPAVKLEELPPMDGILLSHYHEDHFDKKVEDEIHRDIPIITTPHAKECLVDAKGKEERFRAVHALDTFESLLLNLHGSGEPGAGETTVPTVKVSAMPGKHVPPGILSTANDMLGAVPPTNGWLLELGSQRQHPQSEIDVGYRIYISGDTLFVDELRKIPEMLNGQQVDLMLIHLGGTTIPGPSLPLLMVTMDAEQGIKLMQLIDPDVTIPIHFDDYDVFRSPLADFKDAVQKAGWTERVVYLDRGEEYRFKVKEHQVK